LKGVECGCQNGFRGTYYKLQLGRAAGDVFAESIGFRSKRKQQRLLAIVSKPHSNAYRPMSWKEQVTEITVCNVTPMDIQVYKSEFSAAGLTSHNSWIKSLEYGMAGYYPILQDFTPYQPVRDDLRLGDCCGFVKINSEQAWFEAIMTAVGNIDKTRIDAATYQEGILSQCKMSQNVNKWLNAYDSILSRKGNTWFPKKIPVRR